MKYSGFLEFRKRECGAAFLKHFARGMIDVSIVDRNNDKMGGRLMYKVQGKKGFFHKDSTGNADLSSAVIQFTKMVRYCYNSRIFENLALNHTLSLVI